MCVRERERVCEKGREKRCLKVYVCGVQLVANFTNIIVLIHLLLVMQLIPPKYH